MIPTGGNRSTLGKPVSVSLCQLQTSHGLTWYRTRPPRDERPATNRLRHGTALMMHSLLNSTQNFSSYRRENTIHKGKAHPTTCHEGPKGGAEVKLYSFLNLGARWGGLSTPRPGRFIPRKDPVPIVLEAGWAPGPIWTNAENLAPHRDSISGPSSP